MTSEKGDALGVIVVIAGQDPHQVADWKSALEYVKQFAQGDDPVLVSMFTLYWGPADA